MVIFCRFLTFFLQPGSEEGQNSPKKAEYEKNNYLSKESGNFCTFHNLDFFTISYPLGGDSTRTDKQTNKQTKKLYPINRIRTRASPVDRSTSSITRASGPVRDTCCSLLREEL